MKRTLLLLIFAIATNLTSYGQLQEDFNVSLLSQVQHPFPDTLNSRYNCFNDCWGYTKDGIEYGILGTCWSTLIYDLQDPSNPKLIQEIPGTPSVWRDIKSFEDYLYVVADEGSDGLLIVDMSEAPEKVEWSFWQPEITTAFGQGELRRCHNLYIDSRGYLFLAGCNREINGGGILIFSLVDNPQEPVYLSAESDVYSHDAVALNDHLFSSRVLDGTLAIIDISNVESPEILGEVRTSGSFTHNAWMSDDGNYVFTTDERPNAFVDAYDITDPQEIRLIDQYQPSATLGRGVIPHNVHYHQGYLIISYYTEGIKVVDANRPENLVEVGSYDTYTLQYEGFNGCWGSFPYFESGITLASDRATGLWVMQPELSRASYLEGFIRDALTKSPLANVLVQIQSNAPNRAETDFNGSFSTGIAGGGHQVVSYTLEGYQPMEVEYEMIESMVINDTIELSPQLSFNVTGRVIRTEDENPVVDASVAVFNDQYRFETTTNGNGEFSLSAYPGVYQVASGKWGYEYQLTPINVEGNQVVEPQMLSRGYIDNFFFDFGWMATGNTPNTWAIGIPAGNIYNGEFSTPDQDVQDAFGNQALLTGPGLGISNILRSGDTAILESPPINLSGQNETLLSFELWYFDEGFFAGDDTLQLYLLQNGNQIPLETISSTTFGWKQLSYDLDTLIDLTESFEFGAFVTDIGNPHILEVALDHFRITDRTATTNTDQGHQQRITIYPNPVLEQITIATNREIPSTGRAKIKVVDISGRVILNETMQGTTLNAGHWPSGIYILEIEVDNQVIFAEKIIKS